jgi:hypothetical protein
MINVPSSGSLMIGVETTSAFTGRPSIVSQRRSVKAREHSQAVDFHLFHDELSAKITDIFQCFQVKGR